MYQMAIRQETQVVNNQKSETYKKLLMLGAIGGILIGVLLSLTGIFLSIEIFLVHFETRRLEIVFLVSSFGFFAFGAHCMDKIDRARKAERIARCRQTGMRGSNNN